MRRPQLIFVLAWSNLLLLSVVLWQAHSLRQRKLDQNQIQKSQSSSASSSSRHGNSVSSVDEANAPGPNVIREPKSGDKNSVTNWPRFDWRQVESTDYRTYLKNLRAIGCPEQTLRDIVSADVLQAFSARRAEVAAARYRNSKFWEFDDDARTGFMRQRRLIDDETRDMLRELLGNDFTLPATAAEWRKAERDHLLAFLPSDKQIKVHSVLSDDASVDVEMPYPISEGRLTTEQTEELQQRLEKFDRQQTLLKTFLTAEEYEQLDLTVSSTSDNLRQGMEKFHPSENEFRAIFPVWRAHDERIARLWAAGKPDPGNDYVFAKIRELLGETRFTEYRSTWWK